MTLDQITRAARIAAPHADEAEIGNIVAKMIVAMDNESSRTVSKPAPVKAASTPKVKRDWRTFPASRKQVARINAVEKLLGYRQSTARIIGTAGDASNLYANLKAELA